MTEQPTLFTPPQPKPLPERPKPPKSVAHGVCPGHVYDYKMVGLIPSAGPTGRHLLWRPHKVRTGLGDRWRWCNASDAPLCRAPAIRVPGSEPPRCPCGH